MTEQTTTLTEIKPLFVVDTPPYLHRGFTIQSMMRDMLIALLPAAVMAIYYYGIPALRVMALAAGTAVLTEALWQKMLGHKVRIYDYSALVSGLLLAFLLPAGAPWWLVVIGAVASILLGKQFFGGLGSNPLCTPLVGWAILTVSWPLHMDPSAMNLGSSFVDPLLQIKYFGYESVPADQIVPLLLGQQLGGLGSSQVGALLLGGVFLAARGAVRWEIPAFFLLGVLLTALIFWHFGEGMGINFDKYPLPPPPHLYFLTGSTIFAAFFLATEPACSPVALGGLIVYGLLGGALLVLIRVFGAYPDSAPFAVLLASLGTPMFDLIRRAPYGKRR